MLAGRVRARRLAYKPMADIFLSYSRRDLRQAEAFATALGEEGWTVWWDAKLYGGEQFRDVIERELAQAKCVIVLWSKDSVRSLFVLGEASRALHRRIVVPVLLQQVEQPIDFSSIHAEDLTSWSGTRDSPQFRGCEKRLLGTYRRARGCGASKCGLRTGFALTATPRRCRPSKERQQCSKTVPRLQLWRLA